MSSLSIGKAWDEAKAALQANRKLIMPVALGLVLLPAVIASMVEPQVAPGEQPPAGAWMLVVLAMLIVMMIGQLAIVLMASGWRGSVGEAIGRAARRAPTLILAALAIMVPVILLLSLVLAVTALGTGGSGDFDVAALSTAGWLVLFGCALVLLFVSIRILPLVAIVACEPIGPIAVIKRAFSLTSGHFWQLLGFVLTVVVAFLIVAMTVGAVVGGLAELLLGPPVPWSISLVLMALAGGLVQAAFVAVYTTMLARIYAQLSAAPAGVPEVKREE